MGKRYSRRRRTTTRPAQQDMPGTDEIEDLQDTQSAPMEQVDPEVTGGSIKSMEHIADSEPERLRLERLASLRPHKNFLVAQTTIEGEPEAVEEAMEPNLELTSEDSPRN